MAFNSVPAPNTAQQSRGYGTNPASGVAGADFASTPGHPTDSSPLSHSMQQGTYMGSGRFDDLDDRGSSVHDLETAGLQRTASAASSRGAGDGGAVGGLGGVSRNNTLKKKGSISRKSSLKRSSSRRSIHAGSIKGVGMDGEAVRDSGMNSVFYTPVPTAGAPTDILANRFQGESLHVARCI